MENIDRRKSRSVSLSDRELSCAEKVMYFYHLRSVSDAIRFLILRENAWITEEQAQNTEVK